MAPRRIRFAAALLFGVALSGCFPGSPGPQSPGVSGGPYYGGGPIYAAGGDATLLPLLFLVGVLASVPRGSAPYGPNDEAGAARLRSAHIHARAPFAGWPPP